ncbi:MAG: DUF3488 and transglutaminase-like domain-containing protein [Pseudomonadota bacterium]
MKTTAENYLAQSVLLRLLGMLALVVAPHLLRMPLWISLLIVALILWRATAARRNWPLPNSWLRTALTLLCFSGVYASFGRPSGQTAGTALLALMLVLKLTEMRSRRDVMVVVSLSYFMLFTHFLFSQELWTVLYLLVCAAAITAVMVESNHGGQPLPLRVSLRMGTLLVAQALPLMLILFVLFPRIPGPLWGLPSSSGAARTGLSDSMAPGDISGLIQSNELVFRVRFEGEPPPARERYWRGPSFERFNGRRWTHMPREVLRVPPAEATLNGRPVRYEITLEPHDQLWMFSLDIPDPATLPHGSYLDQDLLLTARKPVRERWLYSLTSLTDFRLEETLTPELFRLNTLLPADGNPQAAAWAQQLRQQYAGDGAAIAQAILQRFRNEDFYYTLQPPQLARNAIDDFLFNTRRGFCEHYSSTFTFLMRAAGIPARVVTGYQGGDYNELGDYFIVSQSDAHAWSEFWLPGRGWTRADPTAAVAPIRIERNIAAAIPLSEGLPGYLARGSEIAALWEARTDWIEASWNRWVLAYGPELQSDFLRRFGLVDWGQMVLALTVLITVALSLMGAAMLVRSRPVTPKDAALKQWQLALRKLARAGYTTAPAEGPRDFIQRVAQLRPDLRGSLHALADAYLQARYIAADNPQALQSLSREAHSLKLQKKIS